MNKAAIGKMNHNIEGSSSSLILNRCYRLWPLMTALYFVLVHHRYFCYACIVIHAWGIPPPQHSTMSKVPSSESITVVGIIGDWLIHFLPILNCLVWGVQYKESSIALLPTWSLTHSYSLEKLHCQLLF